VNTVLNLQVISCAMLTGLIWVVQVVHYRAFRYVSEDKFQSFHRFHTKNMTYVVLPLMLIELSTGTALVVLMPDSSFHWLNLIGLLLIWVSTFFISVPLHNLLATERNLRVIERLILTNWVRTVLWSVRLGLLFYTILPEDRIVRMTGDSLK